MGPARAGTTVILADDHPLVLEGVRATLETDGRFEVVAETMRAAELIPLIGRYHPDVVLLDVRMPGIDGLTCLARIRSLYPDVRVVMLSMSGDREEIQHAFRLGAAGYILKNVDPRGLAPAIQQALAYSESESPANGGERTAVHLTDREVEVMRLLSRGLSNKRIAHELEISEQTVKFHLGNIFRKLGVSNRTEAARWVALGPDE